MADLPPLAEANPADHAAAKAETPLTDAAAWLQNPTKDPHQLSFEDLWAPDPDHPGKLCWLGPDLDAPATEEFAQLLDRMDGDNPRNLRYSGPDPDAPDDEECELDQDEECELDQTEDQ